MSFADDAKFLPVIPKTDMTDGDHEHSSADKASKSTFYIQPKQSGGESDSSPGIVQRQHPVSSDKAPDEPFPRQDSCTTGLSDDFLTGKSSPGVPWNRD